MRRHLVLFVGLAVLCLMGVGVIRTALGVLEPVVSRPDPLAPPPIRLMEIEEGTTLRQLAEQLEQEHLIKSRWGFLLLGKLTWADRRVQAGEYALHAGMRPGDILADVLNGRVHLHTVTIPEGFTVAQMAETLAQAGLVDQDEFLTLANDREFIRTLDLNVASLEGYLFPNTYRFAKHTKTKDVIQTLVAALWQSFTPELRARAGDINMTLHQVLTLASVIEKETSVPEERELVSAVFHNRLKRRIPLQSDPTVIYALSNFDGNIRKRDLSVKSPYNTYKVRGLPPGPIASPGAGSIKAALYPASVSYLYFVSRNDGTHHFSSSLAEHNKAVEMYQRRVRRRHA
jgi:UPF0755 protein